jgi:hypothetical protein
MAYLCSQWTPNDQIKYFMLDWLIYRLFVLNRGWKRDSRTIMIFVYVTSTWIIGQIKTLFETCITKNDLNGVCLLHLSYLITLMGYLWSQWLTNVQINYVMFDWSICRPFVLNRGWKRYSLQNLVFEYIYSTRSVFEVKTRFEKWITRNDIMV